MHKIFIPTISGKEETKTHSPKQSMQWWEARLGISVEITDISLRGSGTEIH